MFRRFTHDKKKQHNNWIQSSSKSTLIQVSLEKNEGFAYKNRLDKRQKKGPVSSKRACLSCRFEKKTFSKGDTTKWSYKVYKNTEIISDTKPTYCIDNLPGS